MYFNITTQPPVAPDPSYWFVNHLYNRIHFASSTSSSSCGTETSSTFSVGYAYGFVSGVVYYGRLVSEQFDGFYCRIDDSGINVSGPGALTYHIYRDNANNRWVGAVWLGQWVEQLSTTVFPWSIANNINAGQELWSQNGTFAITVPINFLHKAEIEGTSNSMRPWSDEVLVSPLRYQTSLAYRPVNALHIMDLYPGDFTSMATYR